MEMTSLRLEVDETFNLQKTYALERRNSSHEDRIRPLQKLKDWILSHKEDIAKAMYADFRKPGPEVELTEIYMVLGEINHAIKHLEGWMKRQKVKTPLTMTGSKSYIYHEPKGVSLIIAPWNYPFNLALCPLVSALAAGCTVILKPSELTPHTSALLRRIMEEIYDKELVAVVEGGVEAAQLLLKKPFDHIFFTGSPTVGKIVMKAASEHLSSVTLELGGKTPVILDHGCDIKDAAEKICAGKFTNCGQTCIAPDYVLIPEFMLEEFVKVMGTTIQKMYGSKKGIEASKDYARVVNEKHLGRLQDLLADATLKGAKVVFGGQVIEAENYMEPTLLTQVTEDMEVMKEEIFGPILPIQTYQNLEEIVPIINSRPKPLALYLFSESQFVIDHILTNTSSGGVCINDCAVHFFQNELPFGGVNHSGFGKSHGFYGFRAFSNEKGVFKQRVGFTSFKSLYPPYGFKGKKLTQALIKWF
ncbi:aldehyde dehydrogenase family protein [Pararhodonellum marinum]|uniref:aldehyde dehydrogenase family protein n=1 Tax=Pararhodonellum marinum TaxID=2755358 RepID=UPI00188E0AD6